MVGVSAATVRAWRARFGEDGLKEFGKVKEGQGRKPMIPESKIAEIIEMTQHSTPEGQTHWSVRTMAARVGVTLPG